MERQISIFICVIAIIGVAIALYKNQALSKKGLISAIIISGGLGGLLALTL